MMNHFSMMEQKVMCSLSCYRVINKLTVLFLLVSFSPASPSNILAVFPHIGKSHQDVFQPMVDELAFRGHNVTVVSFYPKKRPTPNYTDVVLDSKDMPLMFNSLPIHIFKGMNTLNDFFDISDIGVKCCELFYSSPFVHQLLSSDVKFDLIVTELFQIDCFLGFVHKLEAPFIALSSSALLPTSHDRFANPDNPAFIPNLFIRRSDKMNYQERFMNTFYVLVMKFIRKYYYDVISERIAKKVIGNDMPPLSEIARNTSLVLVNTYPVLNRPRPQVPAVIDVGGMHIKEEKKLPLDLQQYLDESVNGVILFSMGSVLLAHTFPEEKRKIFMEVFSEMPYNIVCKWENDTLPNKPKNVKILKWLPQRDILAHPNVVAFFSHGGLLGTSEAVFCGVPILGMPMFGDQGTNVRAVEASGSGIYLSYETLTKEALRKALTALVTDKRYRENAKRLSELYRHRPIPPLEAAIFWTEHVLKFGGGEHLRVAAVDMPWYQYLLLDVLAGFIAIIIVMLFVVYKIAHILTTFIFSRNLKSESKSKKTL